MHVDSAFWLAAASDADSWEVKELGEPGGEALGYEDDGGVGVGAGDLGDDGGVGDAESVNAVDPAILVNDGFRV